MYIPSFQFLETYVTNLIKVLSQVVSAKTTSRYQNHQSEKIGQKMLPWQKKNPYQTKNYTKLLGLKYLMQLI